jgi:hypothetical protein
MPPAFSDRRKLAAVLLLTGVSVACRPAGAEPTRPPARSTDIALLRDSEVIRAVVPQRTTLAAVLDTHKLIAAEAFSLVQSISRTFDLRRFRAGQPYRLDRFLDGRIREFEYEIDNEKRVLVRRGDPASPSFDVEIAAIPKHIEQVLVEGAITRDAPSLVQALDAAGETIELSLALADVFSGELDFNSDLQPGDTFRLLVERATRDDGGFGGYGPVLAAQYVNAGRCTRSDSRHLTASQRTTTRMAAHSSGSFSNRRSNSNRASHRHSRVLAVIPCSTTPVHTMVSITPRRPAPRWSPSLRAWSHLRAGRGAVVAP